ncbi:GNAT family N-acetyltransferase [Mangrovibacterium lignilyticum]|uniref:GNAT family N-acetyltransferase n=1 Tax=Mangrovibacterium lignilyticum TaxID=2668052 RepID=UPI0013D44E83|nr:GNAT family N-acetyltransferase [Mangrovibacterium lignilyticum]
MDLETKRLKLTAICWDDAEDIHRLHSLPEVDKYNTLGIPQSLEETKANMWPRISDRTSVNRTMYHWKITRKDTDEFIGEAGMTLSANKFKLGEIFYNLLPAQWGRGYATEVARRLIKAGFDDFKLHKVEAGVATENAASIRVLEKSGMIREGLRRKILPIRGEWKDNYHYAIVEDDPRAEE